MFAETRPPTYGYKLFDKTLVLELYRHKPQLRADAYLSTSLNGELDAIRAALRDGYRWVRSEGEIAIFEKQSPAPPVVTDLIPRHIAARAINGEGASA